MRNWFKRRRIRPGHSPASSRDERRQAIRRLFAESLEQRVLLTAVTAVNPPANSHLAPPSTDITAMFDQEISRATADPQSFAVHSMQRGQLVEAAAAVNTAAASVTLDPVTDFFPGELVQASVTSSLSSTSNVPAVPHVWQFRTAVPFGSGRFEDSLQSLGNATSIGVALGDLDGDGDLDAFVANANQGNRVWWNSAGRFTDSGQSLGDHNSTAISLGDLDADGDLDAFVANAYQGNRVWRNENGRFTDSGQILGSFSSFGASLGDLDGDGDLDAFVVNRLQGNRVWLNNGGSFTDSGQSLGTQRSYGVSLGDLDGDGDLDAFVANGDQGNRIWLNDRGLFVVSGQTLGNHNSFAVSLGDLDGDGDLDAFVANYSQGNRVWLNSAGQFIDSGQSLGEHTSYGVDLGDVDGDGDLDAFVANSYDGNRAWINSDGIFSTTGQILGDHDSSAAALGDLDGDGDLDALVANFYAANRVWVNQNPAVSLSPVMGLVVEGNAGVTAQQFTLTRTIDTGGTATVDYAVVPSGSDPVNADDFAGATLPSGTVTFNDTVASVTLTIEVAGDTSVENDESFLLTISNPVGRNTVIHSGVSQTVIRNDDNVDLGDLPLPYPTVLASNGPAHIAAGPFLGLGRDIEADGQPTSEADGDDVVGGTSDEDGVTFVSLVFAGQTQAEVTIDASGPALLDAWIDFDGDGSLGGAAEQIFHSREVTAGGNVVPFSVPPVARQGATFARFRLSTAGGLAPTGGAADGEVEDHTLIISRPIGSGLFGDSGQMLGDQESDGIALGDLDGDGDLDAFVANRYQGNRVWLNEAGRFSDSGQSLGQQSSSDVALGDLDGDGDLDAFVTNGYDGNRIWLNVSGQFSDSGQRLGNHSSYAVALGDLDADGDLDAVVANGSHGNRVWLNGGGQFTDSGQILFLETSLDAALGDLDGDGDLDAMLVSGSQGNRVWLNEGGSFRDSGQVLGDHNSFGLALGDLDGDGDLDAKVANYAQGNRVWLNGGGMFRDSGQVLGDHDSSGVSLGDLDGDGDLDAFVTTYETGNRVWLNEQGLFRDSGQSLGSQFSTGSALGDLDGDGDLDAFAANYAENRIWLNQNPTFFILPPVLSLGEGSFGTTEFVFTVTRSFDTRGVASVDYAFELGGSGDPAELSDFVDGVLPSGRLTFADGVSRQDVAINVVADTDVESDEGFLATISNPIGQDSVIGSPSALGLILNDDGVDLGDLPLPFATLLADNGPAHFASGPRLGSVRDTEVDGQPSELGDGDDGNGVPDDEDGVTFGQLIFAGQSSADVSVDVSSDALLDAWIDFNGDMSFDAAGERIFASQPVLAGENRLTFPVPADARQGRTFARFRLSTTGGLAPSGSAADGEVEDHALMISHPIGSGALLDSGQVLGGHNSMDVALGDLDADGDLDAFVTNSLQGNRVWLNYRGVFEDSGQTLGSYDSTGIALGDLDGDGDLDAFVANRSVGNRVWLNDGGTFTGGGQVLGNSDSSDVALGDLDGDGDLDAFVANRNQANRVWLNLGGSFIDSGQTLGSYNSSGVALGDLDGDGDLDAFVTNRDQANRIWLNANGLLTDSGQELGSYNSSHVALGDLDGDGDLDAVVGNDGQGDFVWRNEQGVFLDSRQSLGNQNTRGTALGDLDGDGDLDVMVAVSQQPNQVWLNHSGRLRDTGQNLGSHASTGVALGDFDGDGDLDAFTVNSNNQGNRIWFNQNSTFAVSPARAHVAEGNSGAAALEFTVRRSFDAGGTARVDFAFAPGGSDPADLDDFIGTALPSGTLTFRDGVVRLPITIDVAGDTVVENDEGLVLTITHRSGPVVQAATAEGVIRNDDNADLGDLPVPFPTLLSGNGPAHIARGPTLGAARDAEPDGQPSLAADGDDAGGIADEDGVSFDSVIFAGQGAAEVNVRASGEGLLDAWIDFDGDRSLDGPVEQIFARRKVSAGDNLLAFAVPADARQGQAFARFRLSTAGGLSPGGGASDGEVEDHTLFIDRPAGSGVFLESEQVFGSEFSTDVALGDLDGDGDLDAFVANYDAGNRVWLNDGERLIDSGQILGDHATRTVVLGDLDGDGDLDAFAANAASQGNRIWLNAGGVFQSNDQSLGEGISLGVALGDVDGDGDLDAFVVNGQQGNRIWLNNDSRFTDSGQSLGEGSSFGVALGDLDGDGDLDAFVANNYQPNRVWRNDSGLFSDSGQSLGMQSSRAVRLGDLDGDGDLDAFVVNRNQGNRVWVNEEGLFSDSGQLLGDHAGAEVSLGDVDGDGDLDAFVASYYGGNRMWRNEDGQFSDSGQSLGSHFSSGNALGDFDGDGDLDAFLANLSGNRIWLNQNPTFSIVPTLLPLGEGNSGVTAFEFTVIRAFDTRGAASVDFAFGLGGEEPADLADLLEGNLPGGTLTFADGVSSQPVTIQVLGDPQVENDESFTLTLANPVGQRSVLGDAAAVGLILNDDGADFGDLPAPFPTLLDDNGPAHVASGPVLGLRRDVEANGQPSPLADGDDNNPANADDEDGVSFRSLVFAGQSAAEVTVNVSQAARLDAWIDFDGDRSFGRSGEQIFASHRVVAGDNLLTFAVPAEARQGLTFGRFRLSTAGGLAPSGGAADGEVEDVQLVISHPFGSGIFGDSGQLLGDHSSLDVALGDLDGDGDLDAFAANGNANGDRVWLNDSGQFVDSGQSLGNHRGTAVALGDLDNDGDLDAFVANNYQESNRVWLNERGTFVDSGQSLGNNDSFDISLGDLDGDGDLDAFVANSYQANRVWLNDSGRFSDSGQAIGSHDSTAVALGDLDGDGDLDAFVANYAQGGRVWLNDRGRFADSGQSLGSYSSWDVALGDLDHDGDLDAFVANNYQANLVWLNQGGQFSDSGQRLGNHFSVAVSLGDLDGDGDLDAFLGNGSGGNRVWLNANGMFTASGQSLGDHSSWGVSLGDLDGDGDLDAFTANYYPAQANRVWLDLQTSSLLAIRATDAEKAEGNSGATAFTFDVTRTGNLGRASTANFTVRGSGSNPADAFDFGGSLPSGVVNFAASESRRTIVVDVSGDMLAELDESFAVTLSDATPAATHIIRAAAQGTIANDDEAFSFLVTSLVATSSGFVAEFNSDLDVSALNLYDTQNAGLGPADVVVVGAVHGPVAGTLVVDPALRQVTFVKSGDPLESDVYTVTLRSASDGFKDVGGNLLDGDGDGVVGGDFSATFTVAPAPENAVTVSLPDFVRGPGQPVNVPANTTSGIPLVLSDGTGVRAVELRLSYDPALLIIREATVGAAMPTSAVVTLNTPTPGLAVVTFASPLALPAGSNTFVHLQASVPTTNANQIYLDKGILDLHSVTVVDAGENLLPVIEDDAIHISEYFADVSGNGRINASDASLIARFSAFLDSGFAASRLADPIVAADVSGNRRVNAADASRVARVAALIPVPQIPPIPPGVVTRPLREGPDPSLSIPKDLSAGPGDTIRVPVHLDSIVDLQSPNRLAATGLVVLYDPAVLNATSVAAGRFLATHPDWTLVHNLDTPGRVVVVAFTSRPVAGTFADVLVNLEFKIAADAQSGLTSLNLVASSGGAFTELLDENDSFLVLEGPVTNSPDDSVDGIVTITRSEMISMPECRCEPPTPSPGLDVRSDFALVDQASHRAERRAPRFHSNTLNAKLPSVLDTAPAPPNIAARSTEVSIPDRPLEAVLGIFDTLHDEASTDPRRAFAELKSAAARLSPLRILAARDYPIPRQTGPASLGTQSTPQDGRTVPDQEAVRSRQSESEAVESDLDPSARRPSVDTLVEEDLLVEIARLDEELERCLALDLARTTGDRGRNRPSRSPAPS